MTTAETFIEELCRILKEKKAVFQVRYSFSEDEMLEVFDGNVNKREYAQEQGIVLEILRNGRIGRISVSSPEIKDIPRLISLAENNADLIDDKDENFFYDGKCSYKKAIPYKPLSQKLNDLDKEAYLLSAEQKAREQALVGRVISCSYERSRGKRIIKNSFGLNCCRDFDEASAGIYLTAEKDGQVKTAVECVFFDKEEDFVVDNLVNKAVEKAVKKLNAIKLNGENKNVILSNRAMASLLPKIVGLASAQAVQDEKTQWRGKLKQKVAADEVTLRENPWLDGGYGTISFDGEGVPTSPKDVVKSGILQTYLYNLKTAHKDGVKSTGNSSAGGGIGVGNFYFVPGKIKRDELLASAGDAVLIEHLNGLHAGFDIVSGNFSFGAEGFEIKNGKIKNYLEQFTVAGNVYDMLKNIAMIADDLEFYGSRFGSPTIWIKDLKLSG